MHNGALLKVLGTREISHCPVWVMLELCLPPEIKSDSLGQLPVARPRDHGVTKFMRLIFGNESSFKLHLAGDFSPVCTRKVNALTQDMHRALTHPDHKKGCFRSPQQSSAISDRYVERKKTCDSV